MNARGLLFACLALIIGSIVLIPASVHLGLGSDTASTLSSLSLLGGIGTAFMTVKAEIDEEKERSGRPHKKS
jgi:hypothetical protein